MLRKKTETLFPFRSNRAEHAVEFVKCILTRFSITTAAVKPFGRKQLCAREQTTRLCAINGGGHDSS